MSSSTKTVVFIDSNVQDYQNLVDQVKPGTLLFLLNPNQDGIQQITQNLSGLTNIDSVQIISQGAEGSLSLGSTVLNSANLSNYTSQLQQWGQSLTVTGDILLYGSNVAQGSAGKTFVQQISQLTGADVVELPFPSVQPIITPAPDTVIPSTNLHIPHCTCSSCALPPVHPNRTSNKAQDIISPASAALDLSTTFFLNSLAAANHTIYLDFTGHTTTGTLWNTSKNITNIVTPAFDLDGNTSSFSSAELERIQYIWQRVAEDFSPFNVNVTTQAPTDINDLIKSGTSDTRWGIRVVIGGSSSDWFGSAGGVAYINSFNWNTDTPTFVFENDLGNGHEKYTADAIVHEVGHTLGLYHDGRITPAEGYYQGHGSGETGWAPVMGVGYYQNLVQWSKGEYTSANNTEDDLAIITTQNGFGYRADDTGNTITTAKALTVSGSSVSGSGIIERNTDVDFYSFVTGAGLINFTVNPFSRGANLDVLAELYSSVGTLIASSNPADFLSASITATVAAGTYYLKVDGVGKGDPLTTGYTDYGSLGQYDISGTIINSFLPEITVVATDANAAETVLGITPNPGQYTLTRTGPTTSSLTVNVSLTGTAINGTDYTTIPTTVTFAAGSSTALVDLNVIDDTLVEGTETAILTVTSGTGYTVGTSASATVNIADNDLPEITVSVSPATVQEDGATNLVYTF
ncbi:DUF4347 domain-containing protein, partial [Dolichospermum circinale CS-541/06]|uniref:DUF4347 domain-containing protein n=3 Tax=Dolichospermum circinale TaxID=109265 RepID=UPI00232C9780